MADIYERLADYLDELPAGYPRTASGVEMRILRKLFTPEEAELFLHLTLIAEEPRVVAHRAKQPIEIVARRLEEMERKGLIAATIRPGKLPEYMAQHFVVGFWEGQVNRLDRELVEAFEEYLPDVIDPEVWRKAPQLRTIPVGESIPIRTETIPYEDAEAIVRRNSVFGLANCICRQESAVLGHECSKPLETCMTLGSAAVSWVHAGKARMITQEEALAVLKTADEAGLVLQPANSQEPHFICACCGDCCGVLRTLKRNPHPARYASSPYVAAHDAEICSGCGDCVERCQMEAITVPNGHAELDLDRCIGCGLCVSTCSTGALSLVRKPEAEQPAVPKDTASAMIQVGQARGKLGKRELVGMLVKSKADRLAARD